MIHSRLTNLNGQICQVYHTKSVQYYVYTIVGTTTKEKKYFRTKPIPLANDPLTKCCFNLPLSPQSLLGLIPGLTISPLLAFLIKLYSRVEGFWKKNFSFFVVPNCCRTPIPKFHVLMLPLSLIARPLKIWTVILKQQFF